VPRVPLLWRQSLRERHNISSASHLQRDAAVETTDQTVALAAAAAEAVVAAKRTISVS